LWNHAAGIPVVEAGSSHAKIYHPSNPSLLHEGAASSVVNGYFPKQDQASHHVIQIPSDLPDPLATSLEKYTEGFFGNCSKYPWQTFLGFFSRLYSG